MRDDVYSQNPRKEQVEGCRAIQKAMEQQIDNILEQMIEIQALKVEKGDQLDDVHKWSLEIEKQVPEYKQITDDVRRMVKSLCEEALLEAKWEEEKVEEEKRTWWFEEELNLEEARMEIKREFEKKLEKDRSSVKLPKLTIKVSRYPFGLAMVLEPVWNQNW